MCPRFGGGKHIYGKEVPAILFNEIIEQLATEPVQKTSVNTTEETPTFNIYKTDTDKKYVFGWANIAITADGEQIEDLQRDIIDPEDLEEAVYKYVLNFRDGGEEHIPNLRKKATLIESVMFTKEKMHAMGIPEGIVPEGWWIGFYVKDDETWAKIKDGTYQMFSIEGKAIREDVEDEVNKADRINGCGVLVVKDSKVLCGTRIGGKHHGQICGPGGHIEAGETQEDAAIRETREEFGIECLNLKPLGIQDSGRNYGKSAIFACTEYDGEPETDEEEMTDLKWRTIEELEEAHLFKPFEQSLELITEPVDKAQKNYEEFPEYNMWLEENLDATIEEQKEAKQWYKENTVAKSFSDIIRKFNPFHDEKGWFTTARGMRSYSANPKTKDGAAAIARSTAAGYGAVMNVHRESKGENIRMNDAWIKSGVKPSASQLARAQANAPKDVNSARSRAATNRVKGTMGATKEGQPKNPPKPKAPKPQTPPPQQQGQKDALGFSNYDSAGFHQLHSGRAYYNQQKLDATTKKHLADYLNPNTEPGSLYNFSQNMNQAVADGSIKNKPHYKRAFDAINAKMHNIGYNVNLTRYDHGHFLDEQLKAVGISNRRGMSVAQMKKALVGHQYGDKRILSTSYNDFSKASNHHTFTTREVKITYRAKAGAQALMPGDGPGGNFGEMLLSPKNKYKIVDVKKTGKKARPKGGSTYNMSLDQIEIIVEVG